ncbi:hypothetical protein H312_03457 [Anncaliia algerae PRA339]|uniref:Uncharacterized protein n=1 Tax=Anncaliia algerae PRA339 TaxID=1288291 RepID=A0A059EWS2_9MICR|nr:hypothetical protein H312_03457 [Anncaliia algerae PRA339]
MRKNILPMFFYTLLTFIAFKKVILCSSNTNNENPNIHNEEINKKNESNEASDEEENGSISMDESSIDNILLCRESFTDTEDDLTSSSDSTDEYTYESSAIFNEYTISLEGETYTKYLDRPDKSSSSINKNNVAGNKSRKFKSGSNKENEYNESDTK